MTPTASWFGLKGTQVIGFKKSGLAQSIYAELKEHRLNKPVKVAEAKGKAPADEPSASGSEE